MILFKTKNKELLLNFVNEWSEGIKVYYLSIFNISFLNCLNKSLEITILGFGIEITIRNKK